MLFTDIYLTSALNHLQSVMKTLHPGTWPLTTDRQIDNELYDLGVLCFASQYDGDHNGPCSK